MNDPEFQGNETSIFDDPRDNFHNHNYLNPAQQHIMDAPMEKTTLEHSSSL